MQGYNYMTKDHENNDQIVFFCSPSEKGKRKKKIALTC